MNGNISGLCVAALSLLATAAFAVSPEKSLKSHFPQIHVDTLSPSGVPGPTSPCWKSSWGSGHKAARSVPDGGGPTG